jgi:glycosyltransferase involved in cell wall biosynthesis
MLSGDTALAQGHEGPFYQMLRQFSEYWDRIDILTPAAPKAENRMVHGNVFVHPSPWHILFQSWFILWKGRQLLKERDYALIISHDFGVFYNGIGAWLLHKLSQIPYVSEIHHIEGHPFALTRRELIYRWLATLYIRWAGRYATAIRVVNRSEMPEFLRRYGVPENKILFLPSMYIDFSIFHPQPNAVPHYDVLFVGRLVSNKGIFTILQAIAIVKQKHPTIRLCILGEGELKEAILARIDELHLSDNVTLIPRLDSPQEVARLYNQAKMLVCASTSEGGPRVTIEAMACRTPVISTPVGIMLDLLEQGTNFMVFPWHAEPLADRIQFLLENDLIRQQLAENGEIAVQGFRADVIIGQYARGYKDLIGRQKRET